MGRPLRSSLRLLLAIVILLGNFAWATPQSQAATLQPDASRPESSWLAEPSTASDLAASTQQCDPKKDLSGTFLANDQAKFKNTSKDCTYEVGMASYRKFDNVIDHQQIFDWEAAKIKPGRTITLKIRLPNCATQVDIFYGPVLMSLNGQRYGSRLFAARHLGGNNFCQQSGPATATAKPPTATAKPTSTPKPG